MSSWYRKKIVLNQNLEKTNNIQINNNNTKFQLNLGNNFNNLNGKHYFKFDKSKDKEINAVNTNIINSNQSILNESSKINYPPNILALAQGLNKKQKRRKKIFMLNPITIIFKLQILIINKIIFYLQMIIIKKLSIKKIMIIHL